MALVPTPVLWVVFGALDCGGAIEGNPRGEGGMGEEEASDMIACRRFEPIVGVIGRTSVSAGEIE